MSQSKNVILQLYQKDIYLQFHANSSRHAARTTCSCYVLSKACSSALSPRIKLRDKLEGRKEEEGLQ